MAKVMYIELEGIGEDAVVFSSKSSLLCGQVKISDLSHAWWETFLETAA